MVDVLVLLELLAELVVLVDGVAAVTAHTINRSKMTKKIPARFFMIPPRAPPLQGGTPLYLLKSLILDLVYSGRLESR